MSAKQLEKDLIKLVEFAVGSAVVTAEALVVMCTVWLMGI